MSRLHGLDRCENHAEPSKPLRQTERAHGAATVDREQKARTRRVSLPQASACSSTRLSVARSNETTAAGMDSVRRDSLVLVISRTITLDPISVTVRVTVSVPASRSSALKREAEQFRPAQPADEQQGQHAMQLGVPFGCREQARDLLGGEAARLLVRHAWRRGVGSGIVRQPSPFDRLPERAMADAGDVMHAPPDSGRGGPLGWPPCVNSLA